MIDDTEHYGHGSTVDATVMYSKIVSIFFLHLPEIERDF